MLKFEYIPSQAWSSRAPFFIRCTPASQINEVQCYACSEMEFFRHCPQCGRRFHNKLVSKKLEHVDRESIGTKPLVPIRGIGNIRGGVAVGPILVLQQGTPIIIGIEEFQYAYKRKHCGHEWSEKHVEEHKEGASNLD